MTGCSRWSSGRSRVESGQPLLSVVPLTVQSRFRPVPLAPDVPVRLSVFAAMRTDRNVYCLESPLALHRVLLHRAEAVTLIASLASPVTPAAVAASLPATGQLTADALAYLAAAGLVVQAEEAAEGTAGHPLDFAEDTGPALIGWSSTDLTFHTASTFGRHDHHFGGHLPGHAARPRRSGRQAAGGAVHPASPAALGGTARGGSVADGGHRGPPLDPPHGARPITITELGDLLYRTARVRSLITVDQESCRASRREPEAGYELSDRPYPAAAPATSLSSTPRPAIARALTRAFITMTRSATGSSRSARIARPSTSSLTAPGWPPSWTTRPRCSFP